MSMYSTFQTDAELEKKGVVIDYGSFRVTIARAGGANKRFAKVLEAQTKPYRRALEAKTIDNAVAERIMMEVYAETVVLNWEVAQVDEKTGETKWKRGIEAEDGSMLAFNRNMVLETFQKLPDLYADIQQQAMSAAIYRKVAQESEAGN